MAYIGGSLTVHTTIYKALVGTALLFAAAHLVLRSRTAPDGREGAVSPGLLSSMTVGALIGFVSGITGVGGGIFLSPVLILLRWAGLRQAAALSAVFILVNSLSGLAGFLQNGGSLPASMWLWTVAVFSGGIIGSSLGATKLNSPALKFTLGAVLAMAGMKLVMI